jgi:hypothetical protein
MTEPDLLSLKIEQRLRCSHEDRELPESVQPFVERYTGADERVQPLRRRD